MSLATASGITGEDVRDLMVRSRTKADEAAPLAPTDVQQLTLNQRVQGSNPCTPTNDLNALAGTSRGRSDTRSPAHSDKCPRFVLAASRFRAPSTRCFSVACA